MRVLTALAALAALLALVLRAARAEWVQVAVIEQPAPPAGQHLILTTTPPPVPDEDDVIRRPVDKEDVAAERREEEEEEEEDEDAGLPLQELREAHQTLLKQSATPVSAKLHFLWRLKNRLLRHIASLIPLTTRGLFGGGGGGGGSGAARVEEARGHKGVGFPSNEGTLMSLAFLVFAVFLVKVVMQLIYAVQNSQYNNANAGVRVAQMQIPDPMMAAAGVGNMMGTMMNMMPPMMAAMNPTAMRQGRQDQHPDHPDVDKMAARVLEAIHRAKTRVAELQLDEEAPSG